MCGGRLLSVRMKLSSVVATCRHNVLYIYGKGFQNLFSEMDPAISFVTLSLVTGSCPSLEVLSRKVIFCSAEHLSKMSTRFGFVTFIEEEKIT